MPQRINGSNSSSKSEIYADSNELLLADHNERIERYLELADAITLRMIARMNLPRSLTDELLSVGRLGLVTAVRKFDGTSEKRFRTYLTIRVRGEVVDWVRKNEDFDYRQYARLKQAAEEAGTTAQTVINQMIASAKEKAKVRAASRNVCPEKRLHRKQKTRALSKALETLTEEEREIIVTHYFEEKQLLVLERPGRRLPAVSKLHRKTLKKLERKLSSFGVRAQDLDF